MAEESSRQGYKNLDDQIKSIKPKTVDSEAVFQATETNQLSCNWGVSLFSVGGRFHNLGKTSGAIKFHETKL